MVKLGWPKAPLRDLGNREPRRAKAHTMIGALPGEAYFVTGGSQAAETACPVALKSQPGYRPASLGWTIFAAIPAATRTRS